MVYQICTDYQSAPEGGDGYFKMIYFDLTNKKIYMNSYSPVQKDFNYYDTPKLDSYGAGTVAYDIDITELDVDFDTETSKTLSLSGLQVYQLTESQLGADAALENGGAQIAFSTGDAQYVYARLTDAAGQLSGITEVAEVRQTGGDSGSDSGSSSGGGVTQYTITASAGAGGTISPLGTVRVNRGADRTFTITAEEGYVIDDVLVDGRSVGAVSTYTFENVRSGHTIAARFTAADSDIGDGDTPLGGLPFVDVSAGSWYAEAVEYVYSNGVMQGISDASFAPGQNLTRGMIAQILYNLEGSPAGASGAAFTDVSAGSWYAGAVNWGRGAGNCLRLRCRALRARGLGDAGTAGLHPLPLCPVQGLSNGVVRNGPSGVHRRRHNLRLGRGSDDLGCERPGSVGQGRRNSGPPGYGYPG